MDYMGVFVQNETAPPRPITGNDDGYHCSTCEREREVDSHTCNLCSRNWGISNCRLHTEWTPKGEL